MTYFHRRTSTIIGAKAFHCPVRDGKEWDHLAMVVKRNRVSCRCPRCTGPARRPIWEEAAVLPSWASRCVDYEVYIGLSGSTGRDGLAVAQSLDLAPPSLRARVGARLYLFERYLNT